MKLDLNSLEKAIHKLKTNLNLLGKEGISREEKEAFEDACIQAFEYTYELTHKTLKRYLEETEPNRDDVDRWTFQDLIRHGAERGLLLNSWDKWTEYRYSRNKTSHSYDSSVVEVVIHIIPEFIVEAEFLLNQVRHAQE